MAVTIIRRADIVVGALSGAASMSAALPSASVIKLSGAANTTVLSASAYLLVKDTNGTSFYVPAFTTCGGSA